MSVCKPSEIVAKEEKGDTSMTLPIQSAGDHNGNAFPTSSSSSSPSCLGEASPESLCSQSSVSSGYTDSPQDYDMLEVTLTTTLLTETKEIVEDAIYNWEQEEKHILDRNKTANKTSESIDNSISVYLDASAGDPQETRNDNLALSLSPTSDTVDHSNNCDDRNGERHGSSTPDSEATEIHDDDDAEDEALYFSIGSDIGVWRTSSAYTSSPNPSFDSIVNSGPVSEYQINGNETVSPHRSEVALEQQILRPLSSLGKTSEDFSDTTSKLAVTPSADQDAEDIARLLTCTEQYVMVPKPTKVPSRLKLKTDFAVVPLAGASKMSQRGKNRPSKEDLKNIKAKVGSRPTLSPPKITGQNKSASEIERKAAPRNEKVKAFYGGKRLTPSAGTVKMALVLKPIRGGQSTNIKTSHKAATGDSKKSKRPHVGYSGTPSHCTRAMHTEVTEEKRQVTLRKLVEEVSDKEEVNIESQHQSSKPSEECVEDYWEGTGEAPLTLANLDKPKNHTSKVSKLGPTVRQPGKSIRVDKGLVPPPRTGPSGPEGPRNRQSHINGPLLKEVGQSACDGSPVKVRPIQSQSHASPKSSCIGTRSDERASRSNPPVGSQSGKKILGPSSSCDTVTCLNSTCVTSAPKSPAIRSKVLSPQSRTTAPGLKIPTINNYNAIKTATANQTTKISSTVSQVMTKQASHYPLQRTGSARLSGLNGTVDKNKPRDVHARATNNRSSSPVPALAAGNKPQNPSRALVPGVANASASVAPVSPAPVTFSTNTGLGSTGPPALTFKARAGSRSSPKHGTRLQSGPKPGAVAAKHNQSKELTEKKNQASQLWKLLIQANKKAEALATVIQHLFNEREEAFNLKTDLSLELAKLKDELVASSQCCDRLHKEKEEARINLEEALKKVDEQHKEELVQLEDRLRSFYQTEWDKVHQTYQEEADKCRMFMEQQVEEMRTRQEAERKNQEVSHRQMIESLKEQHESSLQELKRTQEMDLENLDKTLKETETTFSDKICELSAENAALNEKLKAEEERRMLADKNLKDSHTLYLEQELESLKVVLEIKNNQLHQKEKKLMEMDKLVETNVKLEECLTKVQQENEDYKARMDKHAALSKQLSSEQAKLQQTLQNESKVNKRLSMENEELLWKLHNGDLLGSPRRVSPTSPFGSPRNSASFPAAAPLSPR
ncbi:microtubule-associated tumor suppressor 1 homolog isoform X2 [Hippocampus comes]|uniref:Microtubule-associated tumor suppressor 1 homolog A-like n=1 Tax=Hippocampus comes TaxID=109280 RepID=A0A3Q2XLV7_HIPCM|nr:PREDICTED: microtubule-associated tumor suppressor 1 homolog isoform X2 [Hippocampus comes]